MTLFQTENPMYFQNEEQIRYLLMKCLTSRGIKVWDCRSEGGRTLEPIFFDKIPFTIAIGDFLIFSNSKYYVVEIKFEKQGCRYDKRQNLYRSGKDTSKLLTTQIDLLLRGSGILIIVSEPPITEVLDDPIKSKNKEEYEEQLVLNYRNLLASNLIPYKIYLFNHANFLIIWDKLLKNAPIKLKKAIKSGNPVEYKFLYTNKLESLLPNSNFHFTIEEFQNGTLVDSIIELLE